MDTARARAEAALRRDATLEAVAFAAQRFLEEADWRRPIHAVLRRLGEATRVSRVYVYENLERDGRTRTVLQAQWVSAPELAVVAEGTELGFEGLERWVRILARGDVVHGPVSELPASEQPTLRDHGITSIMLNPITVGGDWWGYMGFDDCVDERVWSQIEIDALRAAAGTLSAAIDRERSEARLREAETRYRTLIEEAPIAIYTQEIRSDGATDTVFMSRQHDQMFGWTVEEVQAQPGLWREILHPDDRERVLAADADTNREGGRWIQEYRMRHKDGRYVWVRDEATLIRDPDGAPRVWQGYLIDITERKDAEERLEGALAVEREAARRLRALDEMKNTFLQAVSHDLRTPLAAILGLAVTLEREDLELEAGDMRDLAGRIATNARKLDRMVTDLLDLDRLARGIVAPKLHPTDVGALVARVVADSDLAASRRVLVDSPTLVASVDAAKVERILENLLANTARHTPDDSRVWVRLEPAEDGVLLVVEDEGPGVPPEHRETVFEPFRQGPEAPEHSPGVGVGLTLVARFAELMGGRSWVQDRPGGGASFRVYLADGPRTSAIAGSAG